MSVIGFIEGMDHIKVDTAKRMVADCLSQSAKPGPRQLEKLQHRMADALSLWAGRLEEYGKHAKKCPGNNARGICNCGLDAALREARRLVR